MTNTQKTEKKKEGANLAPSGNTQMMELTA